MPIKHYTRKTSPRTYRGEWRALQIFQYVERNKRNRWGKGVARILEMIHEMRHTVTHEMKRPLEDYTSSPWLHESEVKRVSRKELARMWDRLEREFRKYAMWPTVRVWDHGMSGVEKLTWEWKSKNPASAVIRELVRMGEAGQLYLIRKCRVCRKWFFARQQRGWACSAECRRSFYTYDEDWKKYRATKLKEARHSDEPRKEL